MDSNEITREGDVFTVPLAVLPKRRANPMCSDVSHKQRTSECGCTIKILQVDLFTRKGVVCHPGSTFNGFKRRWDLSDHQMNEVCEAIKEYEAKQEMTAAAKKLINDTAEGVKSGGSKSKSSELDAEWELVEAGELVEGGFILV